MEIPEIFQFTPAEIRAFLLWWFSLFVAWLCKQAIKNIKSEHLKIVLMFFAKTIPFGIVLALWIYAYYSDKIEPKFFTLVSISFSVLLFFLLEIQLLLLEKRDKDQK